MNNSNNNDNNLNFIDPIFWDIPVLAADVLQQALPWRQQVRGSSGN